MINIFMKIMFTTTIILRMIL